MTDANTRSDASYRSAARNNNGETYEANPIWLGSKVDGDRDYHAEKDEGLAYT